MDRLTRLASSPQTNNTITYDEIKKALDCIGHAGYADLSRPGSVDTTLGNIGRFSFTPGTENDETRYWVVDIYQFGSGKSNPRTVCFAAEIDEEGNRVDDKVYVHECEDTVTASGAKNASSMMFTYNGSDQVTITMTDAQDLQTLIENANKMF